MRQNVQSIMELGKVTKECRRGCVCVRIICVSLTSPAGAACFFHNAYPFLRVLCVCIHALSVRVCSLYTFASIFQALETVLNLWRNKKNKHLEKSINK